MSKCPLIAKAIVYAVRQATLINQYGMTWDAIETNTANILAGCSVPADGKMNSAEAVSNSINEALKRGLLTPNEAREAYALVGHPTPWKVRRVTIPSWRGPGQPRAVRHELMDDNGRIVGNIRNERVAHEVVRLVNSGGAVALELVDKYHAQKSELSRTKEALRIESVAAQNARAELGAANAHASTWRETALNTARERDDTTKVLDAVRDDLKGSELCRDQLRRDRDGYKRGAQFWMDEANQRVAERDLATNKVRELKGKLETLRTFINDMVCNARIIHTDELKQLLEQTK